MKPTIPLLGVAILFLFFGLPVTTVISSGIPFVSDETLLLSPLSPSTVAILVRGAQEKYHLGNDFYETIKEESAGFQNIQSEIPNKHGPNGRENSWGIAQINLDSHPEITRFDALNVRFAVDWAARQFVNGNQREWTVWRRIYGDN